MTLNIGDLAIISYGTNAGSSSQFFSVVLLSDVPEGEVVKFTDNGWFSGAFSDFNGDGEIAWAAPALSAGTVVTFNSPDAGVSWGVSHGNISLDPDFSLAFGGDQIIAYQGENDAPDFLFMVNNNYSYFEGFTPVKGYYQSGPSTSNNSDLPAALTEGESAVSLTDGQSEFYYAVYSGVVSGTKEELLASIADRSNWDYSNELGLIARTDFSVTPPPPPPSVTIAGIAAVGETLTAAAEDLPASGLSGEITYQWLRNGVEIDGATSLSYEVAEGDLGAILMLQVRDTSSPVAFDILVSSATSAVISANVPAVGSVPVSGIGAVGQTLVAGEITVEDSDGAPLPAAISYQWMLNGVDIQGATGSSYTLAEGDLGQSVRLDIRFTDGRGFFEVLSSASFADIGAANQPATGTVPVTGRGVVGETLTATNIVLSDPDGRGAAVLQWVRNGEDIPGANGLSYTLTAADQGMSIRLEARFTDDRGFPEVVSSDAFDQIQAAPRPAGGGVPRPSVPEVIDNSGNDTFTGGAAADRIEGGAGRDLVSYAGSTGGVVIDLSAGTARGGHAEGDVLIDVENLRGSSFNDSLTGSGQSNALFGGQGSDELFGLEGNDVLTGGAGGDRLDGGQGRDLAAYSWSGAGIVINLSTGEARGGHAEGDILVSIENVMGSGFDDSLTGGVEANTFLGGGGNDQLFGLGGNDQLSGGAGADRLDGGAGRDLAAYGGSNEGVVIDLSAGSAQGGHAEGDVLIDIENLRGSSHDDSLTGNNLSNVLLGDGGSDSLSGQDGNDQLHGGAGGDRLDGGAGNDLASYAGSNAGVVIDLSSGAASGGHAEGDVLVSIEHLRGSGHGDSLGGNAEANALLGEGGNDALFGFEGNDRLNGGVGNDTLSGGEGADSFIFGANFGMDVVVDLSAEDTLVLSRGLVEQSGVDPFDAAFFTEHAVQVGAAVEIRFSEGNVLRLENQLLSDLAARDDLFLIA